MISRIRVARVLLMRSFLRTPIANPVYTRLKTDLGRWYSAARVSKRPTDEYAACLRARYCIDLAWYDLGIGGLKRRGQ